MSKAKVKERYQAFHDKYCGIGDSKEELALYKAFELLDNAMNQKYSESLKVDAAKLMVYKLREALDLAVALELELGDDITK